MARLSMGSSRRRRSAVDRYMQGRTVRVPADSNVAPLFALPALRSLCPADSGACPQTPDLLHPVASVSIDQQAARRALEFAFTAGDSAGIASGALDAAATAPSRFEPKHFQRELFIDELIATCLVFPVAGKPAPIARRHLKRLLCQPPEDPRVVAFRADILRELRGDADLLADLEKVYGLLLQVLALYDESAGQSRYSLPRWRLDLLNALRTLFDALHGPFQRAASGLSRLHEYAHLVHDSEGYTELCALLEFEGDLARVDLHLTVGVDGRVRQLTVLKREEHRTEPFYRGPLSRFLHRVAMFLRGYHIGESDLVERWFDHVYQGVVEFLPALLQLRGDLEFYLSACHFAHFAEQKGLAVCLPEWTSGGDAEQKQLRGLFNPLLLSEAKAPVPCDLALDSFRRCCIVTGPNSGGKTRLLQALALSQLMGQAGMFVPAQQALLRPCPGMFVSLGEEATADQKEGRLGTELLRIRALFESALPGSLVILDELCSGTNPSEGEEIFHLVVELLRHLEPEVFITTHFLQFAQQLAQESEVLMLCFLQVELDADHAPTYQFLSGVASTSLAQQTAARLGVTREELLRLIRKRGGRTTGAG